MDGVGSGVIGREPSVQNAPRVTLLLGHQELVRFQLPSVPDVRSVKSSFRRKIEGAEYAAISASLLGIIALLLACLGIVGLVSYSVSQRTKEIGIRRMALGASPAHILSVVVRQLSRPILAGSLAGLTGAAALSQLLRRELYPVSNLDPMAYLVAISLFAVMVAVAALLPAKRALRVDPLRFLRYE